jgi:CRP/FNR family transcriptional regulator
MAIKFADPSSKSTLFCPNERCLLHQLKSDQAPPCRPVSYRRGTILFEQGQPVVGVYSICSGWLKVARRTVRGKVAGLDVCSPGDLLGAQELLADEPVFESYAQALSEVTVIWLDRSYLFDLMGRFSQLLLAFVQRTAQLNEAVQHRLSHALHAGLEEKIAYLISYLHKKQTFVQMCVGGGQAHKQTCRSTFLTRDDKLALSNYDIAELVGSTPETVSKVLCDFVKRGLISRDRCHIEVLDHHGLAEIGEFASELLSTRV